METRLREPDMSEGRRGVTISTRALKHVAPPGRPGPWAWSRGDFSCLRFLASTPTCGECSLWLFLFRPHRSGCGTYFLSRSKTKFAPKPRPDAGGVPRKPMTAQTLDTGPHSRPQNGRNRGATSPSNSPTPPFGLLGHRRRAVRSRPEDGGVAERPNARLLKSLGSASSPWVQIPLPPQLRGTFWVSRRCL